MIEDVTYATRPAHDTNGAYITVYGPDGSYVSRHRNMEEASESAIAHANENDLEGDLEYRFVPPEKHMVVRRRSIILPPPQTTTGSVQPGSGGVSLGGNTAIVTGDTPYDLSGHTIPFAANWPTAPTLTRSVSVASASAFNTEAAIDGTEITVSGNFSGNITVSGNDISVIASDRIIDGDLDFGSGVRKKWLDGTVTGFFSHSITSDLLMNNLHMIGTVAGAENHNFSGTGGGGWSRIALINSTFEVLNGVAQGTWAAYVQQIADGVNTPRGSDLIFCNVRLENDGGQNNRIQDVLRHIVVDSAYNGNGTSANGLRLHHSMTDVYHADNVIVGANISTTDSETQIFNGTFLRVTRYHTLNNSWSNGVGTRAVNVTVNDCPCYQPVGTPGAEAPLGEATGSNNLIVAWDGSTYPDVSSYGADH